MKVHALIMNTGFFTSKRQRTAGYVLMQMSSPPSSAEEPPQQKQENEAAWSVDIEELSEYAYPARFKVIIHNDHYTAMEFVVEIFMQFFHKSKQEAEALMLTVHKEGYAIAGIYSRELAESKIRDIKKLARKKDYPLRLSMEKV